MMKKRDIKYTSFLYLLGICFLRFVFMLESMLFNGLHHEKVIKNMEIVSV